LKDDVVCFTGGSRINNKSELIRKKHSAYLIALLAAKVTSALVAETITALKELAVLNTVFGWFGCYTRQ